MWQTLNWKKKKVPKCLMTSRDDCTIVTSYLVQNRFNKRFTLTQFLKNSVKEKSPQAKDSNLLQKVLHFENAITSFFLPTLMYVIWITLILKSPCSENSQLLCILIFENQSHLSKERVGMGGGYKVSINFTVLFLANDTIRDIVVKNKVCVFCYTTGGKPSQQKVFLLFLKFIIYNPI